LGIGKEEEDEAKKTTAGALDRGPRPRTPSSTNHKSRKCKKIEWRSESLKAGNLEEGDKTEEGKKEDFSINLWIGWGTK
jgi:hypothetical protein